MMPTVETLHLFKGNILLFLHPMKVSADPVLKAFHHSIHYHILVLPLTCSENMCYIWIQDK